MPSDTRGAGLPTTTKKKCDEAWLGRRSEFMPKLVAQRQLMISLRDAEVERSMNCTCPPGVKEENRLSWFQRIRIPQENAKTEENTVSLPSSQVAGPALSRQLSKASAVQVPTTGRLPVS